MKKNEYSSVEDFLAQYTGEWNPSADHWQGLDFKWEDRVYRFQTDSMYNLSNTILPDGREARFGVYQKKNATCQGEAEYTLIGEYATVVESLECPLAGSTFGRVIANEDTELLGQD